jgi:protein dithiol oxidoreductase (disulfide-forming)
MNTSRRKLLVTSLAALGSAPCFAPLIAAAQNRGSGIAELNPTQPTETKDKIEVLEFFWYGCIHCYNLEPKLEPWLKKKPADVEFRRVPAVFNSRWEHDASIYYAIDALGLLEKLHRPLFEAIHRDALNTANGPALQAWVEKQGIDPKKFEATYKSFGVQGKTKRSIRMTSDYRIDGTPAIAVHGRYVVTSSSDMLDSVDKLIALIRKNK